MQTESEKEQEGWETIEKIEETWAHDNIGFQQTIKIQEKDTKYRLMISRPANLTEDIYYELTGHPTKWLYMLEQLPHDQYEEILGTTGYGSYEGTIAQNIADFLGITLGNYYHRSNIS